MRRGEMARQMGLYSDSAPAGCMGGMLHMFDWNSAVLGKKLLTDPDFIDGLEAPRNSLDTGCNDRVSVETPKSSLGKKDDYTISYNIGKGSFPSSRDPPRESVSFDNEKRRRSTSVVARLMGLDPLPDATNQTSAVHHQPQTTNPGKIAKEKLFTAQRIAKGDRKDLSTAVTRLDAPAVNVMRELRPLPVELGPTRLQESRSGREVNKPRGSQLRSDSEPSLKDELVSYPTFREHPQEKQLQEFKKQFATKMAIQSHESRQRQQQPETINRDFEVKRIMVEQKLNEANEGSVAGEKNDPKRLVAALDKLNKSPEFQEVLEVLQSNKDFFLRFLQEPNSLLFNKTNEDQGVTDYGIDSQAKAAEIPKKSKTDQKQIEKKSRGGISPSSFARRFMESRRGHSDSKQKKSQEKSLSKSKIEEDTSTPSTSASTPSASLRVSMREVKSSIAERELPTRPSPEPSMEVQSYESYGKKDSLSPGKIVLLRPGSNDVSEYGNPVCASTHSPRHFRVLKDSKDVRTYSEEPRLEHQMCREPRNSLIDVHRRSLDNWESYPCDDVVKQPKEGDRSRFRERERSKESRDIARDIIREARAGIVRELERADVMNRGDVSLTRSGSSGRRMSLLRLASESGEVPGSSDGECTPSLLGRDYYPKSGSTTALSSPGSVRTVRSQDSHLSSVTSSKLAEHRRRERAVAEKEKEAALLAVQLEEQQHLIQKGLATPRRSVSSAPLDPNRPSSPRRSSSHLSSKVLRKAIVGSMLETQITSDSNNESNPKSGTEKLAIPKLLLKGERIVSNLPSEEESATNSPRTLQRCRSVPNAAVLRERIKAEQSLPQQQSALAVKSTSPSKQQRSHEPPVIREARPASKPTSLSSKPFADSYKRGVEAVGSLFARAKSKERNKIFVRGRKKSQLESGANSKADGEDFRELSSYEVSEVASPLEWSGALTIPSREESEVEAGDLSDIKRISVCSDVGSCDQAPSVSRSIPELDLREALSMITPRGQVRMAVDPAVDQCTSPSTTEHCNSPAAGMDSASGRSTIMTDTVEVPDVELTPRTSKFQSIETEESRNGMEEPLDACGDRGGQPSPISVLDSPFEELESPSPREFKEITSDLQELRLRLRLLKLEENDRPRPSLDSTLESDVETPEVDHSQEFIVREAETAELCQKSDLRRSETSRLSQVSLSAAEATNRDRAILESINLDGFSFPAGRRDDLVYVRDLLVASEFVQSPAKVFTRWHTPNQPLDSILFENLEDYYSGCEHSTGPKDEHTRNSPEPCLKSDHRLLFDAVNDVLLKRLGPYMTFHPWVQPSSPLLLRPMPSGRQLVLEIWTELCTSFPSGAFDAANTLLERDLSKSDDWMCQRDITEHIGLDLERAILSDLIDDTALSLTQLLR